MKKVTLEILCGQFFECPIQGNLIIVLRTEDLLSLPLAHDLFATLTKSMFMIIDNIHYCVSYEYCPRTRRNGHYRHIQ